MGKNIRKEILYILIIIQILNISDAFGKVEIKITNGIVNAEKGMLSNFLSEINNFELITYKNIFGKEDDYIETKRRYRKYGLVFGIETDLDRDGNVEYFIAGFNKDKNINWKTFVLILTKEGEKYIRRKLIPLYDVCVLKFENCDKKYWKYCENNKIIIIGKPESEAWGFIYWDKKYKEFKLKMFPSNWDNPDE